MDNNEEKFVMSNDSTNISVTPVTEQPQVVSNEPQVEVQSTVTNVGNTVPVVPTTEVQLTTVNTPVVEQANVGETDTNTMVNEKLKKVEINYTPPSKFKVVLMIIFFIALLAMIIFLPDISSLINKYRSGNLNTEEDIITTGRLICTLSSSTSNLDKNYSLAFKFTNSKLDRTEFVITTRGDPSLDEEALDKLNNTCKQLKINTKKITGVTVQCNYANGKLEEIQTFDLANIDTSQLTSAFEEAGGNNPEYKYQQDIDSIEKNMNASGYKCKRER